MESHLAVRNTQPAFAEIEVIPPKYEDETMQSPIWEMVEDGAKPSLAKSLAVLKAHISKAKAETKVLTKSLRTHVPSPVAGRSLFTFVETKIVDVQGAVKASSGVRRRALVRRSGADVAASKARYVEEKASALEKRVAARKQNVV